MNGVIWLWKHRHCWEQLRYLYEHRYSLKLALGTSSSEHAEELLARLRDFDRMPLIGALPSRPGCVPPVRPWKVSPPVSPPLPGSKGRIEKAMVLPTSDGTESLFVELLDPAKEIRLPKHGREWAPPPTTRRLERMAPQWAIDAGTD